jgi:hypothetical protein
MTSVEWTYDSFTNPATLQLRQDADGNTPNDFEVKWWSREAFGRRRQYSLSGFFLQLVKIFWSKKFRQNLSLCEETAVHLLLRGDTIWNSKKTDLPRK